MEIKDTIKISAEFARSLGARYRTDGKNSGQEFLEDILLARFEKAVKQSYVLLVDLNDLSGFPASFVSGSFGKLSVMKGSELVLDHLNFKSEDNRLRAEKAIREIRNPRKDRAAQT